MMERDTPEIIFLLWLRKYIYLYNINYEE